MEIDGDGSRAGYDAAGNMTTIPRRDGSVMYATYDAWNRMVGLHSDENVRSITTTICDLLHVMGRIGGL